MLPVCTERNPAIVMAGLSDKELKSKNGEKGLKSAKGGKSEKRTQNTEFRTQNGKR
jgi:hypothetical protein